MIILWLPWGEISGITFISFDTCLSVLFAKEKIAVSSYGAQCFQFTGQVLFLWRNKDNWNFTTVNNNERDEKVTRHVLCINDVCILKVRVWKEGFYPFRMLEMMIEMKPVKLTGCSWSYLDFQYFSYKILKTNLGLVW